MRPEGRSARGRANIFDSGHRHPGQWRCRRCIAKVLYLSPGVAARANQTGPNSSVSQRQCVRAGAAGIMTVRKNQEQESASVLIRPLPLFLLSCSYIISLFNRSL